MPPGPPYGFLFSVPGEVSMASIDFDAVRRLMSMRDVLGLIGWKPRTERGDQLRGPCPLHGATSPDSCSFSVDLAKGRFQCFQCKAHGNQLDLYASMTRQRIHPAARELCRRLGRRVPYKPRARKRSR